MNRSKFKRKKYFSSNLMAKKNRDLFVKTGLKGFLCTCNGNEKQCIRESYNILNEYADKLFGEENFSKDEKAVGNKNEPAEDVMDEFQMEVDSLKTQTINKSRRFQALDTSIINCIFIETNLDDPVSLLHNIMLDLSESKQKKVRFLLRMVPIEVTCKAFMDDMEKTANTLFDKYFKTDATTYAVIYTKRHNSTLERDAVIEKLATIVQLKNNEHKVNLTSPKLTIIVEVLKNICGLAVVEDYFKFSKFNLHSICGIENLVTGGDTAAKETPASDEIEKSSSNPPEVSAGVDSSEVGDKE